MKIYLILCLVCLVCLGEINSAYSQNDPFQPHYSIGLKHLRPKENDQPVVASPQVEPPPAEDDIPILPVYKALTLKESLVKIEDLEKWDHLDEAALAHNNTDIKTLVDGIETDRGAVSPQGLFLTAQSLSNKNMMEQAAVYYLVGQLRLAFDMARWPAYKNPDDVKRLSEDTKKTPDQSSPNRDRSPRIDNPHQGIQNLAEGIGQPIIAWMMKKPDRMNDVLNKARLWDSSAPYAYDTGYEMGEPIPFEKWEKLLVRTRETYFSQMNTLTKALERAR